jgi:hypothetical protein
MSVMPLLRAATVVSVALLSGCNLLNTADSENAQGRGAQAFDPYQGARSGAIKLALQSYKGCATSAIGVPYGKGSASIPYPEECESFDIFGPGVMPSDGPGAAEPMELLAGTSYFLGQITLMDQALMSHENMKDAESWIRTQSMFRGLDWTNLSVFMNRYVPVSFDPSGQTFWWRVNFSGAQWMLNKAATFRVEILDAQGRERSNGGVVYNRTDFLAENPVTHHTDISWSVLGVAAPRYPGDTEWRAAFPDFFPALPMTNVRIDLGGSTNPFKAIKVDESLKGQDGAIRLTWSEMPDQPFYFPVRFVDPPTRPASCLSPDGTKQVPCSFGIQPLVQFSRPSNGEYYEPGETYDVKLQLRDSENNLLHPPHELPSYSEFLNNQSNGLQYDTVANLIFGEGGNIAVLRSAGPLQDLRPSYSPFSPNFPVWEHFNPIGNVGADFPGQRDVRLPSMFTYQVPPDAKPGTHVAMVKMTRQFMGEKVTKTMPFFFQVGQKEKTDYPNRVGNCQICHRGVLSLDNLAHGLGVDHIEGCKVCHTSNHGLGAVSPLLDDIHRIHMSSEKYPLEKRDCTVCHITRESATRPSIQTCNSCHPSIHGDKFFAQEYAPADQPNRFSNCAQACHVVTVPSRHLLPE